MSLPGPWTTLPSSLKLFATRLKDPWLVGEFLDKHLVGLLSPCCRWIMAIWSRTWRTSAAFRTKKTSQCHILRRRAIRTTRNPGYPETAAIFPRISVQDLRIIHHRSYLYAARCSRAIPFSLFFFGTDTRARRCGHTILHFRGSNSLNLGSARRGAGRTRTKRHPKMLHTGVWRFR